MNSTTKPASTTSEESCGQYRGIGVSRFRVSAKPKSKKRLSGNFLSRLKTFAPKSYLADGTLYVPPPKLSSNFHKSNYLLGQTIDGLFAKSPVERWLFVTLTFSDDVRSTRKAQGRLKSLLSRIRERYGRYLWVMQPHDSGVIHFHLLVPVDFWTHDGVDLDPWRHRNDYDDSARLAAMSPQLRAESDWWTQTVPNYGFGRVQVAPIYSEAKNVRRYLQKHKWRLRHWPFIEEKSFQFWRCSGILKAGTTRFSWHSPGATQYRRELREYAARFGIYTLDDLAGAMGPHWSYRFRMWREDQKLHRAA